MRRIFPFLLITLIVFNHETVLGQVSRDTIWARSVRDIQKKLALSDEAARSMLAAGSRENAQLDSLNKCKSLNLEDRGRELQRMQQEYYDRIRSILAPVQWQQYQALRAAARDSFRVKRKDKKTRMVELEQNN